MIDTMHYWRTQSILPVVCVALLYHGDDPFEYIGKNGRYKQYKTSWIGAGFFIDEDIFCEFIQSLIKHIPIVESEGIDKIIRLMLSSKERIADALRCEEESSPLLKICMRVSDIKQILQKHDWPLKFFETCTDNPNVYEPDYMNPNHPRFAPTLYAAVKVWEANESDALITGEQIQIGKESVKATTCKQASKVWLYKNSEALGLYGKDQKGEKQKVSPDTLEAIAVTVNPTSGKIGGNPRKKKNKLPPSLSL